MRFDIITVFPEVFDSYMNASILGRAQKQKLIDIHVTGIREFSKLRYRQIDDKPYGGGAGMVLMAEPILKAVRHVTKGRRSPKTNVVILSAKGKQFNQKMAYEWAKKYNRIVLISGRYEGIDERVKTVLKAEEISIGPYVMTDGDVAAMTIVSAVARLVPGVIKLESLAEESHWNLLLKGEAGKESKLEYPHYTRPEILKWKGKAYKVPPVLTSGNHKKIEEWRKGK